jgi:hypothetical protein
MKRVKLYFAIAASVLGFTGVSAAMQLTSSRADGKSAQIDIVRMLDEKRITLRDMSVSTSIKEAINVLRRKYGVPVSFISIPNDKPKTVEFPDEELTLRDALDEFVQTWDDYTYSVVGDALVVHPKSGPFDKVIGGVDIRNAPRLEATRAFVAHLKRTYAEFGSLTGPPIKGDPRSPVYAGRVSLPEAATVLEHLAALVGDHPNVTFSILDGLRPGTRVCVLEQVQSSEAKRAAKAKDHRTTEPPGD